MNTKLEILKEVTGEDFNEIKDDVYRCSNGEAIIFKKEEFQNRITEAAKNEIPYLSNEFLIKYLPEKFHNNTILNDLKELCKFDHTLISNFIKNINIFVTDVLFQTNVSDLILDGSSWSVFDKHHIFYLENE